MSKYVKQTDVLRIISAIRYDTYYGPYTIYQKIRNLPTVEYEPVVHGRWKKSRIPVPVYGGIEISCSSCGRIAAHEYNYCPHCGAKMDGE